VTITSILALNGQLKPLCSRDDHVMKFESGSSRANTGLQASYHCGSGGCSVRYSSLDGYYTLMGMPGHTYNIEEPGVNTLECPVHGRWLYRKKNVDKDDKDTNRVARWGCGIQGCDYSYETKTKNDSATMPS
jgi:hypothetical protein